MLPFLFGFSPCQTLAESVNLAIYICNAVAFVDFCAVSDFKAVRPVREAGAVEAVVWVTPDGLLGGSQGLFPVVIRKYQGVVFGRLLTD